MILAPCNDISVAEPSNAKSLRAQYLIRKSSLLMRSSPSGRHTFRARFLARGNAAVAREQGLKERTVVVEYPSLEKATAAYGNAAYAKALRALGDGAVRDFRIVEGLE